MSTETLKSDLNKDVSINRVNVNVLKNRVIEKQKKEIFQNRIVLITFCLSLGIIGYFVI